MTNLKFCVVEFLEEESVEVVCSSWLNELHDNCYFPSALGRKLQKLTTSFTDPKTFSEVKWSLLPCRVLGFADTYERAREKCKKAEGTSDIDTTEAETCRLRSRKTFSSLLVKPKGVPGIKQTKRKPLCTRKSSSSSKSDSSDSIDQLIGLNLSRPVEEGLPFLQLHRPEEPRKSPLQAVKSSYSRPALVEAEHSISNTHTPLQRDSLNHSLLENDPLNSEQRKSFRKYVVSELLSLKSDIQEILRRIPDKSNETDSGLNIEAPIPIQSLQEFEDINEWLLDKENYNKLVNKLCIIGGRNAQDVTERILRALLDDNFAFSLSLTGKGKNSKAALKGTKLIEVLQDSIRKTHSGKSVENYDIDSFAKKWLKNVSDRVTLKKTRKPTAATN